MTATPEAFAKAAEILHGAQRILISAHAKVDGDALGGMLVMAHGLRLFAKDVVLFNQERIPMRLRFLPGAEGVRRKLPTGLRFDATVVLDTGARHLLGDRFPEPAVTGPLLVCDHHQVTTEFGDVELRDPAAPSAAVVGLRLLEKMGLMESAWTKEIAMALLVSLVEDTGWFRYPSTSPEALRIAALCVAAGALPWELALHLEESNSEASLRLLSLVLTTLERHHEGRLAMLTLTDEQMHQVGAGPDDVLKLVNYARGLKGVEVGALLTQGDHDYYVSLRSKGKVDVARLAALFGGGGHRAAAGCTVPFDPAKGEESRAAAKARLVAAAGQAIREV